MKHLFLFCLLITNYVFCQNNVGIGTNSPASDAALEVKSSTQGILIPRLSTAQRLAIVNPTNGLMVYDSNYNCFYYYVSSAVVWRSICPGPTGPPINSNVQMYFSQGVSTLITDTVMTTVNGLSLAVSLIDTATVFLSSNGSMTQGDSVMAGNPIETMVRLYQNALPIVETAQTNIGINFGSTNTVPYALSCTHWGVSTVLFLPPGTYLFELKTAKIFMGNSTNYNSRNYYAACNYFHKNQGIIVAQVIYK